MRQAFFGLLLLFAGILRAQQDMDAYEQFSMKDGLPSELVYAVLQDRNGFLWISTNAGVSRFDGRNFVNYTTRDGLGDNEILDIYEDRKGRIWFKPFTGRLSYYYNNTIYCDHNDSLLAAIKGRYLTANTLCEDIQGSIYIIRMDNPKIAVIRPDHTLDFMDVSERIHEQAIENAFTSNNKQYVYVRGRARHTLVEVNNAAPDITGIGKEPLFFPVFSSNGVLFLSETGLYTIDDTLSRLLIPASELMINYPTPSHTDILMDKYRNIWICDSRDHAFFYRYSDGKYLAPVSVFEDIQSNLVSFDNENNIWRYNQRSGLYKIPYHRFLDLHTKKLNKLLLQKQVISCYVDSRGNIWLGYNNGHVSRIKDGKAEHFDLNVDQKRSSKVLQIVEDRNGVFWFATESLLSAIMPLTGGKYAIARRSSVYETAIKQVFTDTFGNAYCATLSSENILRLDISHGVTDIAVYNRRGDLRTFSAFFSSDNVLYSSEISGLKRIEKDKVINLYQEDPRLSTRIQHFAENKGIIFLATYSNGLIAMKQDKVLATIGFGEGIPGISCRRIYVWKDTLYVTTNAGISMLVFERNAFRLLRNVTVLDGLLSDDVHELCFMRDTLYAATSGGLSVHSLPLRSRVGKAKPPVVSILGFKANDENYATGKLIEMPYAQQHIKVTFVAPVMDRPEMLQYRYKFAERDRNWTITSNNNVEYSKLRFGHYQLEIQARKYNSDWSASTVVNFTIHAPWYFTWWFLSIVIAAVLITIYLLFIYTVRRRVYLTLRERRVIEQERSRIAADIHDDIGADLTNIVMLSGMLKDNDKFPPTLLNKLENSSHEMINKMNEIIWMLNTTNDNMLGLVSYLNRYAQNYLEDSGLPYDITISEQLYTRDPLTSEFRRNLFLVFKESLHNVVKHAHTDKVDIDIAINGQTYLCVTITDNGKGFDPEATFTGNGMVNMKKRMTAIKGTFQVTSEFNKGSKTMISAPFKI